MHISQTKYLMCPPCARMTAFTRRDQWSMADHGVPECLTNLSSLRVVRGSDRFGKDQVQKIHKLGGSDWVRGLVGRIGSEKGGGGVGGSVGQVGSEVWWVGSGKMDPQTTLSSLWLQSALRLLSIPIASIFLINCYKACLFQFIYGNSVIIFCALYRFQFAKFVLKFYPFRWGMPTLFIV